MTFKPAEWTTATNLTTWGAVVVFLVTLILSFWGAHLWARIICPIFGVLMIASWLFSVKGYAVNHGALSVEHPLWSDRFEVRGIAPEDRRPGNAVRLFASNWIFGHTLGLCYDKKIGMFFVYMTNPDHRLYVETANGLLVISPKDEAGLSRALSGATKTQHL
jgi:Bacterial PH domain